MDFVGEVVCASRFVEIKELVPFWREFSTFCIED